MKCQVFVSKLSYTQKFKVSAVIDSSGIKKDITPQEIQNTKCAIYLRVYIARKRTMKSTGYDVELKRWDQKNKKVKSSYRLAKEINCDLLLKIGLPGKRFDPAAGYRKCDNNLECKAVLNPSQDVKATGTNIFQFVDQFKKDVVNKRDEATIENYTKHTRKLELYHKSFLLKINLVKM